MPRDELDGFDRLYLNHGLTTTWDGSVDDARRHRRRRRDARQLDDLHRRHPSTSAPNGRREHGIEGDDGEAWTSDVAALERELGVAESDPLPPKDAVILRGAERSAGRRLRRAATPTRCDDCGSCPFGCRRGTKQSGIRVHLADATAAGAR